MGVQTWKSRRNLPFAHQIERACIPETKMLEESVDDWVLLQEQVSQCTACELHQTRSNTIFGTGNLYADWMIVGDAPNEEEELAGEPFVGASGHMLNQMLLAIGVTREQVFIVNVLKCRPPNDRDPKREEVASCEIFLLQQINKVKPKVILAVGRIAAQNLLGTKETIGHLREIEHQFEKANLPLVATFHPAYLLKSPLGKSKVWADLVRAKKIIDKQS